MVIVTKEMFELFEDKLDKFGSRRYDKFGWERGLYYKHVPTNALFKAFLAGCCFCRCNPVFLKRL